jgi:hypothetical protein
LNANAVVGNADYKAFCLPGQWHIRRNSGLERDVVPDKFGIGWREGCHEAVPVVGMEQPPYDVLGHAAPR